MSKRSIGIFVSIPVLAAIGLALLVVWFGYLARYRQPSSSMYPGSRSGDTFTVNRFDKTPVRGAVMVFKYPEHMEQEFDKRVIGLPGDTITVRKNAVFIGAWEIPHCLVGKHDFKDSEGAAHSGSLEVEFLGDQAYLVFYETASMMEGSGPFLVKADEYFVMGDNRDNSHDSRTWFGGQGGGVPNENTVGRARTNPLALPPGAEALQGAFDLCLSKRPSKTLP